MLEYLVTSKVRRRLLLLLWGDESSGSASDLAAAADVSFAGAHVELEAMQRAGLVVVDNHVFTANEGHPAAKELRALIEAEHRRLPAPSNDDARIRSALVAFGAPLRGTLPSSADPGDPLETLVAGVRLARRDPVVARAITLCFWKLRESLDIRALMTRVRRAEDKHALGFLLALTGELGRDRRLVGLAEALRDHRMKSVRPFFANARKAERSSEFPLAASWGFRMNIDLASFRDLFDKFAKA